MCVSGGARLLCAEAAVPLITAAAGLMAAGDKALVAGCSAVSCAVADVAFAALSTEFEAGLDSAEPVTALGLIAGAAVDPDATGWGELLDGAGRRELL